MSLTAEEYEFLRDMKCGSARTNNWKMLESLAVRGLITDGATDGMVEITAKGVDELEGSAQ